MNSTFSFIYYFMRRLFYFLILIVIVASCGKVELFERTQNIKNAAWDKEQVPTFNFEIEDTSKAYQVYVVVRHTNEYPFRNIWLNVGLQQPEDTLKHQQFELPLAAPDKWLGNGMDDIFEHRALLFPQPVNFPKAGTVTFSLQHTMRRNPLPGVMQVGIRVEPVK
jgi:gliding motility-associated lipoprotein GldH